MSNVGVDSYTLKMIEQVTGPLRKIEEQMERTSAGMEKLGKLATNIFAGGVIVAGIGLMGKAIGALIGVMQTGIGVASRFGSAVLQATTFRTQNITALETFLGGGRGGRVFDRALSVGGITPANEMEVVKQVKSLAAAGFKGIGLSQANAALLDVQAMLGDENSGNLSYYFQKFIGGRKVEADDLRMASFSAGLQEKDVMTRVLQNMGVVPSGDSAAMGKQFDELKKAGKVQGRDVIQALMQGINERLSEGKGLGTAARKMGEGTLSGLMSNLEAAPQRFLAQMKLENLPGIKSVMAFLQKLLVFFDHGTEQGKKLTKIVESMINTLFGGLDKITEKDLARFFESALKVAEQVRDALASAWDVVDKMMHGNTGAFAVAFGKSLVDVGMSIGKGMWEGLWAAMGDDGIASPGLTPGMNSALGKELGEQAIRAGSITPDIWSRAGGRKDAEGYKAMIDYLTWETTEDANGIPDIHRRKLSADLAAQVEAATSQASGTVETVAEAGASTVIGTVVINAQRKEAAEIRREFENLIKGKKQRKGGKR